MPLVLPRRSLNLDFVRDGQASGDNYPDELSKLDALLTFARASTATRFNAAGNLETVAAGQPRFDFDPVTLACKGLLIEESRTNHFFRSDDIGHASWGNIGTPTITSNDAASGSAIATKISGVVSDGRYQSISGLTSGGTRAYAVEAKAGTQTVLRMQEAQYLGDGKNFDLSAGTCDAGAQIIPLGNGWYRCLWPRASAGGETIGSMSFQLVGTGYLWVQRAQLEDAAFSTSYIPTTTAAVTRVAERCYTDSLNPWFNAAQGALITDFTVTNQVSTNYPRIAQFVKSDDTNYIRILHYNDGLYPGIATGGAEIAGTSFAGSGTIGTHKLALRYKVNDFAFAVDGGAVVTDLAGAVPVGMTRLTLGSEYTGGAAFLNGYLRRLTYLPHTVSDGLLKALSTP